MKKRLLVMLLLLCLLLTALTATVSAFTVKVNGEDVRITFGIDYHCDICKTYPPVNDDDYTINSFQAYTEDGEAAGRVEVRRWSRPFRKRQGDCLHEVCANKNQRRNV